jgi:hypothetical protein
MLLQCTELSKKRSRSYPLSGWLHALLPISSLAHYSLSLFLSLFRNFYRYSNARREVTCPLVEQRVAALNEAGSFLLTKCDGLFSNFVRASGKSAVTLSINVARCISSFEDIGFFPADPTALASAASDFAQAVDDADWKVAVPSSAPHVGLPLCISFPIA